MLVMEGCLVAGPAQKWRQTPLQGSNAICLQVREKEHQCLTVLVYATNLFLTIPARPRRPLPNRVSVDGSGTGEFAAPVAEKVTGPFP